MSPAEAREIVAEAKAKGLIKDPEPKPIRVAPVMHIATMRSRHGKRTIIDEFTDLPVSSQRKLQLRRKRDGICERCTKPRFSKTYCQEHAAQHRERQRVQRGSVERYHSLSYGRAA